MIAAFLFIILFFYPVPTPFEGNIISEQVSFVYRGKPDKLFLNSMRELQRLEFEGIQEVEIFGEFRSAEKIEGLETLNQLTISLQYPDSKFILEGVGLDAASQLELDSLRLQPKTAVRQLTYYPERQELSFEMEILEDDKQQGEEQQIPVKLFVGENPLKVIVEGAYISQLDSDNTEDNLENQYRVRELEWTPWISELLLSFDRTTQVNIGLPEIEGNRDREWFWGNLAVTDVDFSRRLMRDDLDDTLEISTILEGQIHFLNQLLTLESEQFLILPEPSSIERLSRLELHPQSPPGLQVRLNGKTDRIAVGIDPNFPVSRLKSNVWEQRLPRELVGVLLTICSVAIGYLIPWIFT
ncbi:hypothetical protein [Baaleninema sp.]|uniref:hypothetical protein n=1 Tax=Baaleninema sp. TaxID=3101197 RepID=UPI003D07043C